MRQVLALLAAFGWVGAAHAAQPSAGPTDAPSEIGAAVETRSAGGPIVLPASGAKVVLPAADGVEYYVSGRAWRTNGRFAVVDDVRRSILTGDTHRIRLRLGKYGFKSCDDFLTRSRLQQDRRLGLTVMGKPWKARAGRFGSQVEDGANWAVVLVCSALGDGRFAHLTVRFAHAGPVTDEAAKAAVAPLERLLESARLAVETVSVGAVKPATDVAVARPKGWSPPKSLRLGKSSLRVPVPADGQIWQAKTGSGTFLDALHLRAPSVPGASLFVEVAPARRESCTAFLQRIVKGGKQSKFPVPSGLPAGWSGGVGDASGQLLCKVVGDQVRFVKVVDARGGRDVTRYAAMIDAIGSASIDKPAPRPPDTKPKTDPKEHVAGGAKKPPGKKTPGKTSPPPSSSDGGLILQMYMGTEVAVSYRDTAKIGADPDAFPAWRTTYLGLDYSLWLADSEPGFSWGARVSLGFSLDWYGAFDDVRQNSPSCGGTHLYAEVDGFIGAGLGRSFLGLGVGWHGISGPVTMNSSIAVSAMFGYVPEDPEDVGFMLRVTPIQAVAANERQLLSPLVVETRIALGTFGFGLEFHWIDAPEPGDEDIPAEAFGLIFRLGLAFQGSE